MGPGIVSVPDVVGETSVIRSVNSWFPASLAHKERDRHLSRPRPIPVFG